MEADNENQDAALMDDPLFGDGDVLFGDDAPTAEASADEAPADQVASGEEAVSIEEAVATEEPMAEEVAAETVTENGSEEVLTEAFTEAEAAAEETSAAVAEQGQTEAEVKEASNTEATAEDVAADKQEAQEVVAEGQQSGEANEEHVLEQADEDFMAQKRAKRKYSRFQKYRKGEELEEEMTPAKWLQKNFLYIVMGIMGLLLAGLFAVQTIEIMHHEQERALEGYVKVNFKIPEWHHGEVPEHIQEIIDQHHYKKEKEKRKFVPVDPHAGMPMMGDTYPEELTNDDLLLIIEYQDIGKVTRAGIEKTELMNLSGLDLRKIDFTYLKKFTQANLKKADFSDVFNHGANFRAASLQGTKFVNADLESSNFVRARMNDANFDYANLAEGDFKQAIAKKARFINAKLTHVEMRSADFRHSNFDAADLSHSDMKYANFEGSSFIGANLEGVSFYRADLRGVDFTDANLAHVDFTEVMLDGANLEGADVTDANFKDANIFQANLYNVKGHTKAQLDKTKFILGAKRLPEGLYPKKEDWKKRFQKY